MKELKNLTTKQLKEMDEAMSKNPFVAGGEVHTAVLIELHSRKNSK